VHFSVFRRTRTSYKALTLIIAKRRLTAVNASRRCQRLAARLADNCRDQRTSSGKLRDSGQGADRLARRLEGNACPRPPQGPPDQRYPAASKKRSQNEAGLDFRSWSQNGHGHTCTHTHTHRPQRRQGRTGRASLFVLFFWPATHRRTTCCRQVHLATVEPRQAGANGAGLFVCFFWPATHRRTTCCRQVHLATVEPCKDFPSAFFFLLASHRWSHYGVVHP